MLFKRFNVVQLDDTEVLADAALARFDPELGFG